MPPQKMPVWACKLTCLFFLSAATISAVGQQSTLALGAGSASDGGVANLTLSLTNSGGAAPTALQFAVGYPTASVSSVTLSSGPEATASGASLDCVSEKAGTTSCLLYGSSGATINTGQVGTVSVKLVSNPTGTSIPLTLSGVMASNVSGEATPSSGSGSSISVVAPTIKLSSLSCSPSSFNAAGSAACTITVSGAPTSALTVSLSSSDSSVIVPTSVSVAAGATTGKFTASVASVKTAQSAVLTASEGGTSVTSTLSLSPTPTAVKLSISGSLGSSTAAAGDSVSLHSSSGTLLQTVTSNTAGAFTFSGLAAGTYTVTPTKSGFVFSPTSRTVTLTTANVTGVNFTILTCTHHRYQDHCRTSTSLPALQDGPDGAVLKTARAVSTLQLIDHPAISQDLNSTGATSWASMLNNTALLAKTSVLRADNSPFPDQLTTAIYEAMPVGGKQ